MESGKDPVEEPDSVGWTRLGWAPALPSSQRLVHSLAQILDAGLLTLPKDPNCPGPARTCFLSC